MESLNVISRHKIEIDYELICLGKGETKVLMSIKNDKGISSSCCIPNPSRMHKLSINMVDIFFEIAQERIQASLNNHIK